MIIIIITCNFQYRAVKRKVLDFIPMGPVAFAWILEIHAVIYSIGINDFYMLVCVNNGFNSFFFTYQISNHPWTQDIEGICGVRMAVKNKNKE